MGAGQHGSKALPPEVAAHQGECAAGEAVEGAGGVDDIVAAGVGAGKLDDGLDALTSGAAEEDLGELSAGMFAKGAGECAGFGDDVALEHGRALALELGDKFRDDVGMVVSDVVDAVSGETIEDGAAVLSVELRTAAVGVLEVHAEDVKESDPDGVDVLGVGLDVCEFGVDGLRIV